MEFSIPQITGDLLWFGGFEVPLSGVVKWSNDQVLYKRGGIIYLWEFTDRNFPSARWQCTNYSPEWLTIL